MAITGDFSAPWKIKNLISASSTWQTLCGADDPLDHIAIFYGEDDSESMPFPRCIIPATAEEGSALALRRVGLGVWNREGTVQAVFEIEIPVSAGATTLEEEGNWFVSQTGAIASEVRDLVTAKTAVSGENPIEINQIAPIAGPARLSFEEREQLIPQLGVSQLPLWVQTIEFSLVP